MTHRLLSSLRLIPCILRPVSPSLYVIIRHIRGLFSRESCDQRHSLPRSFAYFYLFFNLFPSPHFPSVFVFFISIAVIAVSQPLSPPVHLGGHPLLRVALCSFAGDGLCKCACLTFLLRPIYVTQAAECEVSVSETDS